MTTRIQLDRSGPIATLWLDRPDKRNALDDAAMKAIAAALDELGADRATRVVIMRGKGPVFSSGIDHTLLVGVAAATQHTPFLHLHHQLQDVFHRMSRLHQPIIAAVHGACVGMALELALAADVRAAKITDPEWRESFLRNLPENARTLALAEALQA